MTTSRRLQIVRTGPADITWVNLETVADLSGLHPEMIEEFVRADVIRSFVHRGELYFDEDGLYRLRQIHALHSSSGINLRMIRMIIGLIDRLESTENELRRLRERIR